MHYGSGKRPTPPHYGRVITGIIMMALLIVLGMNVLFYQNVTIDSEHESDDENQSAKHEEIDNENNMNIQEDKEWTFISGLDTIRVLLKTTDYTSYLHDHVEIYSDTGMKITHNNKTTVKSNEAIFITSDWKTLKDGETIYIEPINEGVDLTLRSIVRTQGNPLYQGKLEITRSGNQYLIVNEVLLETYLYSVVPSEMPSSYAQNALMAQAVFARTYAYTYMLNPALSEYHADLDDSVSYQVYNNIESNNRTSQAVDDTRGMILLYDEMPANTYFYSTSCGLSADETVWNTNEISSYPYLTMQEICRQSVTSDDGEGDHEDNVNEDRTTDYSDEKSFLTYIQGKNEDDYDYEEPYYRWSCTVEYPDPDEFLIRLQKKYEESGSFVTKLDANGNETDEKPDVLGRLEEVKVIKRDESGSASVVLMRGSKASYYIKTCNAIRYCLATEDMMITLSDGSVKTSISMLPSAFFVVTSIVKNDIIITYKLTGGGFGHGVGMSQNAAGKMAEEGMAYEDILTFFIKEQKSEGFMMQIIHLIRDFLREIKKDNISAHAASAAFFLFLSLIPMLILLCSILPYTPIKEADLMLAVTELLPTTLDSFAITLIEEIYGKSATVISITAIATIWASSKGILAIMRGLNSVNEVDESRNYFTLRAFASIDTLVLLLMIIISLLLMVFGNVLMQIIYNFIPGLELLSKLFLYLRFFIVWSVLTLLFVLLYVWLPNKRPKAKTQLLGACFTSTGWIVFSFIFSVYINNFNAYSMYGSLTAIIIVLIWLYAIMYIMLLGAELNSMFDEDLTHFPLFRTIREKKHDLKEYNRQLRLNAEERLKQRSQEKESRKEDKNKNA